MSPRAGTSRHNQTGAQGWRRTLLLAMLLVAITSPPSVAQEQTDRQAVFYSPPMFTRVIDPFRPPAHIGAPGNRGLEYGRSDNQIVAAAASGRVVFAGQVAGFNAITILHDDGVRTSYTGLLEIWVDGELEVNQGRPIALASRGFHLGARINDRYLDPQILIDASEFQAQPRLVPPPDDHSG